MNTLRFQFMILQVQVQVQPNYFFPGAIIKIRGGRRRDRFVVPGTPFRSTRGLPRIYTTSAGINSPHRGAHGPPKLTEPQKLWFCPAKMEPISRLNHYQKCPFGPFIQNAQMTNAIRGNLLIVSPDNGPIQRFVRLFTHVTLRSLRDDEPQCPSTVWPCGCGLWGSLDAGFAHPPVRLIRTPREEGSFRFCCAKFCLASVEGNSSLFSSLCAEIPDH